MSLFTELQRRNVLRVAAAYLVVGWLLTEVLTTILPTLGAPDWAARGVVMVFAFGFIPTILLSWTYEFTPEGLRKERRGAGDEIERVEVSRLDYLAICGVIMAVVVLAFINASQAPQDSTTGTAEVSAESIAVLPFVNMSNDENNEYFSDGLTDTLLHMLAQVPDLKVAARTSSFAFKGKNMDIREIADALQVAHVLEGSVQLSGNRIRITAQLIRASDGYHIWSEIFDRDSDDIFGIQDEIAQKVGRELSASLLGGNGAAFVAGVGTDNPDAYDLYLQALKQRETFSFGGLEASERLLKGALTIDPDFLDAKTELASNYLHQLETGLMSQDEAFPAALAIANQVLVADPDDVGANAIKIYVQAAADLEAEAGMTIAGAVSALDQLVAQNPREYQARILLTRLLVGTARAAEALQLQLAALADDPYNARIHFELGALYLALGDTDSARNALQTSLDIEPRQPNAYLELAQTALRMGDGVDYLQQSLLAMEIDPRDHEIPGFIAIFLYSLGLTEEADDFRDRVLAIAPTSVIAYRINLARAVAIGDREASLEVARSAIENNIEDRQFAWGSAVQYFLRDAILADTIDAARDHIERHAPGALDVDAVTVSPRSLNAQIIALDAWYVVLDPPELQRRIARIQEIATTYGVDLLQDANTRVSFLVLEGRTDAAVELALLDVFPASALENRGWRARFQQAQYGDFVVEPRIQQAIKQWEAEEAEIRDRVQSYLNDLSAAS